MQFLSMSECQCSSRVELLQQQLSSVQYSHHCLMVANTALASQLRRTEMEKSLLAAKLTTALQQVADLSAGNPVPVAVEAPAVNTIQPSLPASSLNLVTADLVRSFDANNDAGAHIDFEEDVLQLYRSNDIEASRIRPARIAAQCETAAQYKRQFIPFVKEDMRCEIAAGLKEILQISGARPRHPVPSTAEYRSAAPTGAVDRLLLTTFAKDMPKVDHGWMKVVVAFRVPGCDKVVLGIASRESNREDDQDSEELSDDGALALHTGGPRKVRLVVKMLPEACASLARSPTLEWFELCALIPALRKHEACLDGAAPKFMESILQCSPKPWPAEAALNPTRQCRIATLNEQQQSVVNKMCTVTDGGLYNLIGPPGTGKTSTIVHLLAERVRSFPTQKILLTAPSNKAVQVVLDKFLKTAEDTNEFMVASLRVAPDSLAATQHVCPYTYIDHVLQPFAELKVGPVNKMAEAYSAACELAIERVRYLVERRGLAVPGRASAPLNKLICDMTRRKCEVTNEAFVTAREVEKHTRGTEYLIRDAKYAVTRYILQKAHIVFATLVASGGRNLYKAVQHFDCVIVDEAAQALIPETFIPFKFGPALYVLIGDPQQLPGMVHSSALESLGYAESLMGVLTEGRKRPHLERLTTQYRMHPSICKWVSDQFYDGELVASTLLANRSTTRSRLRSTWPLTISPSAFVDCNFLEAKGQHGAITNAEEAHAVMHTVKYLLKSGVTPGEIGVITFYSAQVKLLVELRSKLARELPNIKDLAEKLTISTVDGFQGDERDYILISCVRSCPSAGFLSDHRRINVAMSRAKHARWVFGNASALRQSNSMFTGMWTANGIKAPTHLVSSTAL
jgi:hypothetical protein